MSRGAVRRGLAFVSLAIGAWTAVALSSPRAIVADEPEDRADNCVVCHADPEIRSERPELYVRPETIAASMHDGLSCTSCHPQVSARLHEDTAAEIARARAACADCHRDPAETYEAGVHGSASDVPPALEVGPPPAPGSDAPAIGDATGELPSVRPTCVTCHGNHEVPAARSRSFVAAASSQCSRCHGERGESFFDRNYHGKETRLGREDAASCADCHEAHRVLPSTDVRSPVSEANLLATCRVCHPTAPPNFADIEIHVLGQPLPSDPKLGAVTLYMLVILVGTFGFFGAHTLLAIRHSVRERRRRGPAPEGGDAA